MGRRERRKALREGLHRTLAGALTASLLLTALPAVPAFAVPAGADFQGSLASVASVTQDGENPNQVNITFNTDSGEIQGRITFLEDDIFHYVVDPSGEFEEYAEPRAATSSTLTARIQAQPDSSDEYSKPEAEVNDAEGTVTVSAGETTVSFDKDTAVMTVLRGDTVVMQEAVSLAFTGDGSTQTLVKHEGENYYGGGTQNGRFVHTGTTLNIAREGSWTDGGVASPNPFYWSSEGYGVLRNTFADGTYDFGEENASMVRASHGRASWPDNSFDAYVFVADPQPAASEAASSAGVVAQNLLQNYFEVTGDAVLLPEYAFYLGHLNAYNRDAWSEEYDASIKVEPGYHAEWNVNGETTHEYGLATGYVVDPGQEAESLNGSEEYVIDDTYQGETPDEWSARAVIDEYQSYDMPLGWFLPNDGYGAGYGHNGYYQTGGVEGGASSEERLVAVNANVTNLGLFSSYANSVGVQTGLWTQSYLLPDSNANTSWHLLRDFNAEVTTGGVTALKTDVAWVGPGYSMALGGIKQAYDIITTNDELNLRPTIVTLNGWAGTQRYGGIWTGDQTGGNWEYIRFHIPTYIGQSLSGNPNIGSDMDGIFGGDPIISAREYQWKTFTPLMLDMDGWGSYAKMPYTHGEPYMSIARMYLKLKSQLMPYIYTSAASAANIDTGNGDTGLPMIRAMVLEDDSDEYAASTATQYQYMFGESFLVAPVYQDTQADGDGNDIRNNIYLPGTADDVWIDYWTGEQYRGGQVINNYDAPLWKLPLFVKGNAIVPMHEANNNPQEITSTNPDGLDRTVRIVDFYPTDGEGSYTSYEDDGTYLENNGVEDEGAYDGLVEDISYGGHVSTTFTSKVEGSTATLTAQASQEVDGGYDGYDSQRSTTFRVSVSAKPTNVTASNGSMALNMSEKTTKADFDAAEPAEGEAVWFYDESPVIESFSAEGETQLDKTLADVGTTPRLYVKLGGTDVSSNAQTVVIEGFQNDGNLGGNTLDESLAVPTGLAATKDDQTTPTSIGLTWNASEGAVSYDLKVDGTVFNVGADADGNAITKYTHVDLGYNSTHTYQVRARSAEGNYSRWSAELTATSLEDPWRNVPAPVDYSYEGGEDWGALANAFDHDKGTMFHSSDGGSMNIPLTIDYGMVYEMDKFVYTPRTGAGNGTVTSMKIETSLDGSHWNVVDEATSWVVDDTDKVVDLGGVQARYLRLTPLSSNSGHFSANELAMYKADGTSGTALGNVSPDGGSSVTSVDVQNMTQYLGAKRGDTKTYYDQLYGRGDVNNNGWYDAYDYAFTMASVDGGTRQTGDVAGALSVVPGVNEVKQGDIITVSLYASDVENANALGATIEYDASEFEFVTNSIQGSAYLGDMTDLSIQHAHDDGTGSVNLAYANRADKPLYDGSGVVATFQLKALADVDLVDLSYQTYLVGPTFTFVEDAGTTVAPELPEPPTESAAEYAQNAFSSITMTNDILTTDDKGTNVESLIQQGGYDGLFDGDELNNDFEFKWDISTNWTEDGFLPDCVKLPTAMTFSFAEPSVLDSVEVVNRDGSNGTVTSMDAVITFEGGDQQTFTFGSQQNVYELAVDETHKGQNVTSVSITPKTSSGAANANPNETDTANRMLTLREINFNYTTGRVNVDGIEASVPESIYTGDVVPVTATVTPEDNGYPHYTVESSDSSKVSVSRVKQGDGYAYFLMGVGQGEATITVASAADPSISKTFTVSVVDGIDLSALVEAQQAAAALSQSPYTEETWSALQAALADALLLIESGTYSKMDVENAVVAINSAIDGLAFRPVSEGSLINKDANSGVIELATSSTVEGDKGDTLDGDSTTYWHSSYAGGYELPQWIMFDLGGEYDLTDVTFLPRPDGALRGDVVKLDVVVANSQDDLQDYVDNGYHPPAGSSAVNVGTFEFDNNGETINDRTEWKQATFAPQAGRYVMIVVTGSLGNDQADNLYCNMAETRFYGTEHLEDYEIALNDLQARYDELRAEYGELLDAESQNVYTADTWTPFANAMADAQRLIETSNTSVDTISQCLDAINSTETALVESQVTPPETVDREALQTLVDQLAGTDLTGVDETLAQRFSAALAGARTLLNDPDATQAQINAAYDELKAAFDALKPAEPEVPENPAHDDLQELISKVEGTDLSGMTEESAQAFRDALAAAQALGKDADEKDLKAAYEALAAAYEGLRPEAGGPSGGDDQKPGDNVKPGDDASDGLAGTGDASLPVAGVAAVAVLAVAVAVIVRLRTRRD